MEDTDKATRNKLNIFIAGFAAGAAIVFATYYFFLK